jgi:hypothetical protein
MVAIFDKGHYIGIVSRTRIIRARRKSQLIIDSSHELEVAKAVCSGSSGKI